MNVLDSEASGALDKGSARGNSMQTFLRDGSVSAPLVLCHFFQLPRALRMSPISVKMCFFE